VTDALYRGHRVEALPAADGGTWHGYVDMYEVVTGPSEAIAVLRARTWVDRAISEQEARRPRLRLVSEDAKVIQFPRREEVA